MSRKTLFTVQPFQPEIDNPAEIAAIHLHIRRWQKKIGQNDFSGHMLGSQADLKDLEHYYVARGGNFFIAKDAEGKPIGFVGIENKGGGQGAFKRLAVVAEWHRKGVARTLVAEAMDWAKQAGFTKLNVQTHSREHAKRLYEQFGFRITGWVEERQDWLMERGLEA